MSCKRSDAFLGDRDVAVRETVDARKEKFTKSDLKKLFEDASKLYAMRGKKSVLYDMKKDPPSQAELEKAVLGPSGGLRAPSLRMGKTWIVGFSEPNWEEIFD